MSISIRQLTSADITYADQIQQAAYGGPSRRMMLELYLSLQPDGWLLASYNGAPAGIAGGTNYGALGHIGLVAVDPAQQRRGIALAMMQQLLAWFETQACSVIQLDASDQGAPLYCRLGFVEDEQTCEFTLAEPTHLSTTTTNVARLRANDIPALVEFDTPIFGADRSAVFSAMLALAPERAWLAYDSTGQIKGYLFAQAQVLGPWAAHTSAIAEALLATAIQVPFTGLVRALVPSINPHAAVLLQRYGFRLQRALSRMRYGGNAAAGQRTLMYGQASFAIG